MTESTLYNGIQRPDEWPPRTIEPGGDPLPVPYLANPPRVMPIDIGRQLFVDDFLIEHTTLRRVYHAAKVHEAAPVLVSRNRPRTQPATTAPLPRRSTTVPGTTPPTRRSNSGTTPAGSTERRSPPAATASTGSVPRWTSRSRH